MGEREGKEKRKAARSQSLAVAAAPKALLSEKILLSKKPKQSKLRNWIRMVFT